MNQSLEQTILKFAEHFHDTWALKKASNNSGLFPAILGKGHLQKLGKNDQVNIIIGRN